MSPDRGIAGRDSLGDLVYKQWDLVVAAVEGLPRRKEEDGIEATIAFVDAHLHGLVDSVALALGKTPEAVEAAHRVHSALGEGQVRLMSYGKAEGPYRFRAGILARAAFLRATEREMLSHSIRAVFDRSRPEEAEEPYVPDTS